jgi:NADH:ubiquinone oxidoreductase subunit K
VAFWRYLDSETMVGQVFVLLVYVTAIAQTALGLALIAAVHRARGTVVLEDLDLLKESLRFPPYGKD